MNVMCNTNLQTCLNVANKNIRENDMLKFCIPPAVEVNFGLHAAVAAHMAKNSIKVVLLNLFAGDKVNYINCN